MGHGARPVADGLGGVAVAGATVLSRAPTPEPVPVHRKNDRSHDLKANAAQPGLGLRAYRQDADPGQPRFRGQGARGAARCAALDAGKADGYSAGTPSKRSGPSRKCRPASLSRRTPTSWVRRPSVSPNPKLPKVLVKKHAHWTRIEVDKNVGVLV